MRRRSAVGGAAQVAASSARDTGFRLRRLSVAGLLAFLLCLFLFCVDLGCSSSCPDGMRGFQSSGFDLGSMAGGLDVGVVCGGSGSFCFPSALTGFLDDDDGGRRGSVAFPTDDGGVVSCSLKVTSSKNDEEEVASCKAPGAAHGWMRKSTEQTTEPDEISEVIETSLTGVRSPSPRVEINPAALDWGVNTLYTPSLASLNVTNMDNGSVLRVYDLFSSDLQFYPYHFDKISLVPGESAAVSFVFLPAWLGSSSAHLVMQTNFGGFVIQAKGVTIESPYQIEPSMDGSMPRNFSLYNPFDDTLHVEEVSASISVSSENFNQSAQVICRKNTSVQSTNLFSEWLRVTSDYGLPWLDIRPRKEWAVPPRDAGAVLEVKLWPHMEGRVFGDICMQLRNPISDDGIDTVILPVKSEEQIRKSYRGLTGALSVFLEPHVACDARGSIFSLSLWNDASHLLRLVKVSEIIDGPKFFQVNYMEGLILYPKSVTQIALITYTHVRADGFPSDIPSINLNCELAIVTNDSTCPLINIPCQDLVPTCSGDQFGSSPITPEGSDFGWMIQKEKEKSMNAKTGFLSSIVEEPQLSKPKLSEVVKAEELLLRNWRSQGTVSKMSVLEDRELLFPAVEVGAYFSKWITVHNPSKNPVMMQLVLNSGVIVDQCKPGIDLSENTLLSSVHIDSKETQDGFSIADSARTEAFVHPMDSALFGPVVFHPSKRCLWRSSAFIRNNLSGIEWLPLLALGGSHSLVLLEGSESVKKLEFNFDLPVSVNTSSPDLVTDMETSSASCDHILSKELYAKNTGEIPLEVLKLDVSGSNCGLGGFMIHNCDGFSLAPGESRKLLISYQADFTAAVVYMDLELSMATGIFVIPMKATLPANMLKLCQKSFFSSALSNTFLLIFAAASLAFLVIIRIIPHASPSDTVYCILKNDMATISNRGKPSRPHRNTKNSNSRSDGENEKSEGAYTGTHPSCSSYDHGSIRRSQSRQELDHLKQSTPSPRSSTAKHVSVLDTDIVPETPSSADLTVRIVKERGRRRKRRANGLTSAAKFDVSGSQSGNSTPSSPLSPNTSTPKQIWSLSPDVAENPFSQRAEQRHHKRNDIHVAVEERAPQADKHSDNSLLTTHAQAHVTVKPTGRPTLLPSATFPSDGWYAPGVAIPNFVGSTSIAPHARAPGSRLSNDKQIRREKSDVLVKDFTYNMWGKPFFDLFGRPRMTTTVVSDASEGDSRSFFAREPQSPMMMSSARSVSPESVSRLGGQGFLSWTYRLSCGGLQSVLNSGDRVGPAAR